MEPSCASTNWRAAHQSGCFSTSCFLRLVSQHPLHFPKDQEKSLHTDAGCNTTPDLFDCLLYVCSLQDCKGAFIGNPARLKSLCFAMQIANRDNQNCDQHKGSDAKTGRGEAVPRRHNQHSSRDLSGGGVTDGRLNNVLKHRAVQHCAMLY